MAISLEKHDKINLSKESDSLNRVQAQLSWVTPSNVIPAYDADVSAFMLRDGKLPEDEYFIFYNNRTSPDTSVSLSKDQRSGGVEKLDIDLTLLPKTISEISVIVTLHNASKHGHSFDRVSDANIRILNLDTGVPIAEFKLDVMPVGCTAVHVGTFYKDGDHFAFHAIAEPYTLELQDFIEGYTK